MVTVNLDPVRVARLGLTRRRPWRRPARRSSARMPGRSASRIVWFPCGSACPDRVRYDPSVASTLPIIGPAGWATLGSLGRVADSSDVSELCRENLRAMVAVTGSVDLESSNLGRGDAGHPGPAEGRRPAARRHPGVRRPGRQSARLVPPAARRARLAIGAVLLVMVVQFGGFRGPLAILGAASLGMTGAFGALVVTGVPFNVSSFMGVVLLVGLVVKNGIILLDAAHRQRARGCRRWKPWSRPGGSACGRSS